MDEGTCRDQEEVTPVTDGSEARDTAREGGEVGALISGWVDAPRDRDWELEDYGVDLRGAHWDLETERWEGCLFTEDAADMLAELHQEWAFPYPFEADPCCIDAGAGEFTTAPDSGG